MSARDAQERAGRRPWARRAGWFVLLWCGGVAAVAIVGYGIRLALP